MKREGTEIAVLWAIRIAQAMIITPSTSRTPYFTDTARGYLVGLILHVISYHPENEHHLPYVVSARKPRIQHQFACFLITPWKVQ